MKKLKTLIIILLCFNYAQAFAQEEKKKLYFLADTINVSKENRVLEMSKPSDLIFIFTFYCKCIKPYDKYLQFQYLNYPKNDKDITTEKPNFKYLSWKELMDKVTSDYLTNPNYELYITEVLPDNRYKTKLVTILLPREPAKDFHNFDIKKPTKKSNK